MNCAPAVLFAVTTMGCAPAVSQGRGPQSLGTTTSARPQPATRNERPVQAPSSSPSPSSPAVATPAPSDPQFDAPDPRRAWSAFPMASNCQARLSLTEEVSRLLIRAAAHATTSRACVDGPGTRVAVTDVLVCPAAVNGDDRAVSVYYRMARYSEGGGRGCGRGGAACERPSPTATEHRIELRFETGRGEHRGKVRLRAPAQVPGMGPAATPVDQAHDGGCYGTSPAFEPRWTAL